MIVYVLLTTISLLCVSVKKFSFHKIDVLFFIIIGFLVGFRYFIGTDYASYIDYFNRVYTYGTANTEIAFDVVSKIAILLGLNFQGMFLIFAIITSFFYYIGYKYYFKDNELNKLVFFIIFIIFVFPQITNGVRQIAASSILFFSTKFIVQKKFIKFMGLVTLASLFHFSSIIFIPLYLFIGKNFNKYFMLFILLLGYVLGQLGIITAFLNYVINSNIKFLDVGNYISSYIDSPYNLRDFDFGIVALIQIGVLVFLIIFKNSIISDKKALLALNGFLLYSLFLLFSFDARAFFRLSYLFSIYPAIAISSSIKVFNKESKYFAYILISFAYILLLIFVGFKGSLEPSTSQIIPFEFNFDIFR